MARSVPTCVLFDVGTTSADLIPIVNGQVVAQGRTDPERLLSGELVYTGALRTPAEAVAPTGSPLGWKRGCLRRWLCADRRRPPLAGESEPRGLYLSYSRTADPPPASLRASVWRESFAPTARCSTTPRSMPLLAPLRMLRSGPWLRRSDAFWSAGPSITAAVVAGLGDFIAAEAAETCGPRHRATG